MQRPTGVSIIAILLWLTGVLNVISGFGVMDDISTVAGLIQIVIGAAAIVFGIGCWQLRRWAWLGTIVLMGLNALSIIVIWIQYGDQIVVSRIIWPLIINGVVIVYLLQPDVKAAFED
jgi:hypothetical protein